jgi:hypothetical protein
MNNVFVINEAKTLSHPSIFRTSAYVGDQDLFFLNILRAYDNALTRNGFARLFEDKALLEELVSTDNEVTCYLRGVQCVAKLVLEGTISVKLARAWLLQLRPKATSEIFPPVMVSQDRSYIEDGISYSWIVRFLISNGFMDDLVLVVTDAEEIFTDPSSEMASAYAQLVDASYFSPFFTLVFDFSGMTQNTFVSSFEAFKDNFGAEEVTVQQLADIISESQVGNHDAEDSDS